MLYGRRRGETYVILESGSAVPHQHSTAARCSLDHGDQLIGPVAQPAPDVHEFACMGDQAPLGGGASNGHPASPAKVEQSFVAERPECAQDGVGVHAELGSEIARWRKPVARARLTFGDRSPDLRGDLFMQLRPCVALEVDPEHGASHTSFIRSTIDRSVAPAPPSPEDEAQALFEEARRRTRRRRRRNAFLAIAGVSAIVGAATLASLDENDGSAPGREATPSGAPVRPTRLFVQLLTRTEPLAVANPATGRIKFLPKLPTQGGDPLERLHFTGGRLVWWAGYTWSIGADLRGKPKRLAKVPFIPSATPGRVWFLKARGVHSRNAVLDAVEMTAAGRVTLRGSAGRMRRPCRGAIVAATQHALLCQSSDLDGRFGFVAIDPRTGGRLANFPGPFPLGTHGDLVASCTETCRRVHLSDVATGAGRTIPPPAGVRFTGAYDGAFSPDGRLVAVPVKGRRLRVALIDVTRLTARIIPGSRLAADYRKIAWSSSGELFFSAGGGTVMAYRPGAKRARRLPLEFEAPILDLAVN